MFVPFCNTSVTTTVIVVIFRYYSYLCSMINPFLENKEFNLKVVTVFSSHTDTKGAQVIRTTTELLIEEQKHVKVYKTGNNSQYTAFLFSLNRHARDIYIFIQANLGENQDTIHLHQDKVCEYTGMGRNSYYEGMEDLKSNSIITPFKRNEYWINPFILFRGDRLAYYREYCPDCIENVAAAFSEKSSTNI